MACFIKGDKAISANATHTASNKLRFKSAANCVKLFCPYAWATNPVVLIRKKPASQNKIEITAEPSAMPAK